MKILLADDHQMFRESVIEFLRQEEFCTSVGGAASVREAQDLIAADAPDLLISDLTFPESSGQDLLRWAREHYPQIPAVCLTMHAELEVLRGVLRLGARGYVTKNSGYNELVAAVQAVAGGGYYLDQILLSKVVDEIARPVHSAATGSRAEDFLAAGAATTGASTATGGNAAAASLPGFESLTQREHEVFNLLLDNYQLQDIAEILFVSAKTVENHRSSIYRKLGVKDRFSLIHRVREAGLNQ